MARSNSATMIAAAAGTNRVPYIRIYINSVDYSSRLLFAEVIEEPYRDRGTFIFRNDDRLFDDVNLIGRSFQPGWGYTTGAGNEYCGDGTNDGTPTLWVKNQEIISLPGRVVCQLYCEGMWMRLRERQIISVGGSAPYWLGDYDGSTITIYGIIEDIIEDDISWTLNPKPSPDDGILDTFKPVFRINSSEFEMSAFALYRLISMTKCYLRQKSATTWEIVFPQDADSVDETYYSHSADGHSFKEYMERVTEVIPNRIIVYANNPNGEDPWPSGIITGDSGAYSGNYVEVKEHHIAPTITSQGDADNRAAAILTRLKAEGLAGRVIVPHDNRVELYDKVSVVDTRV